MNNKAQGIILSVSDYRDNDLICQVLFKEYGLLSIVAKGAKKITSKNAYSLLPASLSEMLFDYKDHKTIFTLKSANLIHSYYQDNDILKITGLGLILDITKHAMVGNDNINDIYDVLLDALRYSGTNDIVHVLAIYLARMAKIIGISPYVDGCVKCNESKVVTISKVDGGFLCIKHAINLPKYEVEVLKKFRLINKMNFEHINLLSDISYSYQDLDYMADFFIQNSFINIKSYNFFKTILRK